MSKKDFSLALFVTLIWGLNFSVIKIGLLSLDPFILAGIRFLLCSFPLVFFIKKPAIPMKYIVSYGLGLGVFLWGVVYLGMYFGMSAGIAGLILQTSVFFTVIIGAILFGEEIDLSKRVALLLALIGLVLIMSATDGSTTALGLILVIFAAISMSSINIIAKSANTKDVFSFLVWASLFPIIPLFILAYLTNGMSVFTGFISSLDGNAVFSILFTVYPVTLFAYWIWNKLLHKYSVASVVPLSLFVPIFALIGSYFILGEQIGIIKIIASLLILIALLINTFGIKIFLRKYKGV